ncbi:Trans-aconitate 2-methyltransferase [uncultured archaeon]|nr:Trans-aconitate 2-methyltransferase [uncultured archaeon]
MGKIIERAVDPHQYDLEDLNWNGYNSSSFNEKLFYKILMKQIKSWKNKSVLEIGAGSGWLIDLALKGGAKIAEGIEPSKKNMLLAKEIYKDLLIHNDTIENFKTNAKYDLIISIMAFSHIKNVPQIFGKIKPMLNKNGKLIIIVPDYDYTKTPRSGYKIEQEELNSEEYAVKIKRIFGVLADIVRKTSYYERMAKDAGLKMTSEIPLCPSKDALKVNPRYKNLEKTTMHQLLIFQEKNEL